MKKLPREFRVTLHGRIYRIASPWRGESFAERRGFIKPVWSFFGWRVFSCTASAPDPAPRRLQEHGARRDFERDVETETHDRGAA